MSNNINDHKYLHTKVAMIVALCVQLSIGIAAGLASVFESAMTLSSLMVAILCPIVVVIPVSYVFLRLSRRLGTVSKQLAAMQDRLREAQLMLSNTVRIDQMIGLVNRETFLEMIAPGRRRYGSGFLFIVGADHLKTINDAQGHRTGDRALKAMASAISSSIREGDTAARISGSEFAVFLPGASLAEAITASERICKAIEHMGFHTEAGEKVPLTVSIGGAEFVGDNPVDGVLGKADRLLDDAKSTGRNRAVVVPTLSRAA